MSDMINNQLNFFFKFIGQITKTSDLKKESDDSWTKSFFTE